MPDPSGNIYGKPSYPQYCTCEAPDGKGLKLVADDCHVHLINPAHFMANGDILECDCEARPTYVA